MDETELGGDVSWTAPNPASQVTHYVAYYATSQAGGGKSQLAEVAVGTVTTAVAANAAKASFTHFVVFTKSDEQKVGRRTKL